MQNHVSDTHMNTRMKPSLPLFQSFQYTNCQYTNLTHLTESISYQLLLINWFKEEEEKKISFRDLIDFSRIDALSFQL